MRSNPDGSDTDTLLVAARDEQDTIVWAVLDVPAPGTLVAETLVAEPLQLVAVMASRTVELRFSDHFVPADRVAGTIPLAGWQHQDRAGLRMNGSLALGLAARCAQLIGPGPLDDQLTACRAGLDGADPDRLPAARAAACELAIRAAAALVVTRGATAILASQDAQRLAREALFLLVFGSRPTIKQALAGLLTGGGADWPAGLPGDGTDRPAGWPGDGPDRPARSPGDGPEGAAWWNQ